MARVGEVTLIPQGKKCDVEWKVNFASLSKEAHARYWSSNFNFEGETWCLRMFPNARKSSTSAGFMYLSLYKHFSNNPSINVQFSFSLKTVNGDLDFKRKYTQVFGESIYHTINQFLSKSDFEKRHSEFLSSGFLTVICTLEILNPAGSASDMPTAKCSYCKNAFGAEEISSHEIKCRVKCPQCSDVVLYDNWYDHKCQISRAEGVDSLSQDFKKMLLDGCDYDLILKVGDTEIRAHKNILRARSQVFKSMLSHDMKEKSSGVIDVPDCDPQVMEQFLFYVYSGKVESLDQNNMCGLYYIADKYEMNLLKEECSEFIKQSLSPTNLCDVIQLALNHSDSKLQDSATDYFISNVLDILRTIEWQSFMKDNLTVANELIIKSHMK